MEASRLAFGLPNPGESGGWVRGFNVFKSILIDGITRGFGRVEVYRNRKGVEIGRDPLPDLIEVKHTTGTIMFERDDEGALVLIDDSDKIAEYAALFDGADVRTRKTKTTEGAPASPVPASPAPEPAPTATETPAAAQPDPEPVADPSGAEEPSRKKR